MAYDLRVPCICMVVALLNDSSLYGMYPGDPEVRKSCYSVKALDERISEGIGAVVPTRLF